MIAIFDRISPWNDYTNNALQRQRSASKIQVPVGFSFHYRRCSWGSSVCHTDIIHVAWYHSQNTTNLVREHHIGKAWLFLLHSIFGRAMCLHISLFQHLFYILLHLACKVSVCRFVEQCPTLEDSGIIPHGILGKCNEGGFPNHLECPRIESSRASLVGPIACEVNCEEGYTLEDPNYRFILCGYKEELGQWESSYASGIMPLCLSGE